MSSDELITSIDKKTPIPKYYQIQKKLEEFIQSEHYGKDGKIPPEVELAKLFGVHRVTVRAAMQALARENIIFRERGRGTFINKRKVSALKKVARSIPRSPDTDVGNIGLLSVDGQILSDSFHAPLVTHCEEWIRKMGKHLLLYNTGDNLDGFIPKVDGIILIGQNWGEETIRTIKSYKIPKVAINYDASGVGIASVIPDDEQGAFMATEYLLSLGHRNILYFGGPEDSYSDRQRYKGFQEAFKKAHLKFNPQLLIRGGFSFSRSIDSAKKIFQKREQFSAIFAANDVMASALMNVAEKNNIKIPEDLSLVGFDDLEEASHRLPPLTTVRIDREELAQQGVKILSRLMKGEKIASLRIIIPTELKIRGTTQDIGRSR